MRQPLDDADGLQSAKISCHLWKYWVISIQIARGRYVSQSHTYCTGRHCLRLGVIRIYMHMLAPVGGGLGIFLYSATHLLYRSGSHMKLFIYQQKTGVQVRLAVVFRSGRGELS